MIKCFQSFLKSFTEQRIKIILFLYSLVLQTVLFLKEKTTNKQSNASSSYKSERNGNTQIKKKLPLEKTKRNVTNYFFNAEKCILDLFQYLFQEK